MNDRFLQVLVGIAIVIIVGGGLYALLHKAAPMTSVQPPASPPPASISGAAPAPDAAPEAPDARGPAIYRCESGGKVAYSDLPCKGGRVVDLLVPEGYQAPQGAGAAAAGKPASPARPPAPRAEPGFPPAEASNKVECSMIEQAIASVDAAARTGGSAVYQDDLRGRRHRLVVRRQDLGC